MYIITGLQQVIFLDVLYIEIIMETNACKQGTGIYNKNEK